MILNVQLFARKLVRPFTVFTESDLRNELRALDKICTRDNPHIVNVLRHGPLPFSTFYYIDMQLCDINLNDYIYQSWPAQLASKSRFFGTDYRDVPSEWLILAHIVSGLVFIHGLGEVHRDLKPRNGNTPPATDAN